MQVKEILRIKGNTLFTATPETMLSDSVILMADNDIGSVVVMEGGKLVGMLSFREVIKVLAKRQEINDEVRTILDSRTEQWGVEITAVEIKDISLPVEMKRAMARQAEAERERRAKIIMSEGELQAAEKLAQAARLIATEPAALQLRLYQTLVEVSGEKGTTIVMPVPIELLSASNPHAGQAITQAATALAAKVTKGALGPGEAQPDVEQLKREIENATKK